jgi:hypothetical protein
VASDPVKLRGFHNYMQRRAQYRSPAPPIRLRRPIDLKRGVHLNAMRTEERRVYTIRHRGAKYMKKRHAEMLQAAEQLATFNRAMRRIAEKLKWLDEFTRAAERARRQWYFGRPRVTFENTYPGGYVIRINAHNDATATSGYGY